MGTGLLRSERFGPLFWTQLLGALNDNLFKSALVMVVAFGAEGEESAALINLSGAVLILPFFLFSATAGQIAERAEKARLIRGIKIAEIVIMGIAAIGFAMRSVPVLFLALFLMGTHSAFFGPLKYAVLPQHVRERELLAANGWVEMGTFVAILMGTIAGGVLIAVRPFGTALAIAATLAVAVAGWLVSRRIPLAPPVPGAVPPVDWNVARATLAVLRLARSEPTVWRSILGVSWFWALGAVLLAQLPAVARDVLGGGPETVTVMLALFTIGIGVGSVLCERLSGGRIELGVVPWAGLAMTVFALDLALAPAGVATRTGAIPTRMALDLLLLGVAGGVFVVPLYASMQARSRPTARARVVAANNVLNAAFIVTAAIVVIALGVVGLGARELLLVAAIAQGVATLIALAYCVRWALRLAIGAIVRLCYRVRVEGLEHVPEVGPALLVANHVTFVDAFVLGGLCRRPVRFVMYHRFFRIPALRWFFRLVRAIPIAGQREDPEMLERAFAHIDSALAGGELVCIFPEGKLTTTGEIDVFRPGVEQILARRPVPVVPIALRGLWGSFFSHADGAALRKMPARIRARVEVIAGAALSPERADAATLRARVLELRGALR